MDDVVTIPSSLAGLPALVVPILSGGKEEKMNELHVDLPVGVQLISQFGDDEILFRVGKALEETLKTNASSL